MNNNVQYLIYFIITFGIEGFHNWCRITLDYQVSISGYDTLQLMFTVKMTVGSLKDHEPVHWIFNFEWNR